MCVVLCKYRYSWAWCTVDNQNSFLSVFLMVVLSHFETVCKTIFMDIFLRKKTHEALVLQAHVHSIFNIIMKM